MNDKQKKYHFNVDENLGCSPHASRYAVNLSFEYKPSTNEEFDEFKQNKRE